MNIALVIVAILFGLDSVRTWIMAETLSDIRYRLQASNGEGENKQALMIVRARESRADRMGDVRGFIALVCAALAFAIAVIS